MSQNRALVDSLECYMEDLVDSFEDFVKKSLILMFVGVGTMVMMLIYMLKVITDRTGTPDASAASNTRAQDIQQLNTLRNDILPKQEPKNFYTPTNTETMPTVPYNNRDQKQQTLSSKSSARLSIPDLPTSSTKPPSTRAQDIEQLNTLSNDILPKDEPKSFYAPSNTESMPTVPYNNRDQKQQTMCGKCSARMSIPSLPICSQKQQLSIPNNMWKRKSCCSLCCLDESMKL